LISGINQTEINEINEVVESILSSVPATEIYLFGSFAQGTHQKNSDYDFYVVIPDDSVIREREATWAIRSSLVGKQKKPMDMIVGTQSKFNRRKNYFYSIENEIIETGVKLYG
jgi:predicted nucleotidyltransferase